MHTHAWTPDEIRARLRRFMSAELREREVAVGQVTPGDWTCMLISTYFEETDPDPNGAMDTVCRSFARIIDETTRGVPYVLDGVEAKLMWDETHWVVNATFSYLGRCPNCRPEATDWTPWNLHACVVVCPDCAARTITQEWTSTRILSRIRYAMSTDLQAREVAWLPERVYNMRVRCRFHQDILGCTDREILMRHVWRRLAEAIGEGEPTSYLLVGASIGPRVRNLS